MIVKVNKSLYEGEVEASPSKSYAHRLLISASLKKGETKIYNVGDSEDVIATARCINALGGNVLLKDGNAFVKGITKLNNNVILDAGESGSTLRFLLPIVVALGVRAEFTGKGKLLDRPNDALIKTLNSNGGKIEKVKVNGKLNSGIFEIDASISSQYLTGLLFALPLLDGDSKIVFKNSPVSKNYLDITKEVLTLSGIKFIEEEFSYTVKGKQQYNLPSEVICEGDFSSASFMLTCGALGKSVTVKNLNLNSNQGDKIVIDVLKKAGAKVCVNGNDITASKGQLKAFDCNLENAPDLAPILATLAVFCEGTSRFYGVERLKIKESDRLLAIIENLQKANIKAEYNGEYLSIIGGTPKTCEFNGYNDHRIVMSSVIMAGLIDGGATVTDGKAVSKSYPNFYNDFEKIGGKINV